MSKAVPHSVTTNTNLYTLSTNHAEHSAVCAQVGYSGYSRYGRRTEALLVPSILSNSEIATASEAGVSALQAAPDLQESPMNNKMPPLFTDQLDAFQDFLDNEINDIRSFYGFTPSGRKRARVLSEADRMFQPSSASAPFALSKRAMLAEFTLTGGPVASAVDSKANAASSAGSGSANGAPSSPSSSAAPSALPSLTNLTLSCEVAKTLPITCPDTATVIAVQKIAIDVANYSAQCAVARMQPFGGRMVCVPESEALATLIPSTTSGSSTQPATASGPGRKRVVSL